jgi:hypothetical protein
MIPVGIPKLTRVVKVGSGGPNKDSIPVKEDLGGSVIGYLKNGTVVRIVDPIYPGISKYRRLANGSTWVVFEPVDSTLFARWNDIWCEENGHLFEMEPLPPAPEEGYEYEVLAERWETGGKRFLKLKKT